MNRIIITVLFFFTVNSLFSQNNENKYDEELKDTIYDITKVTVQAEYKGGNSKMMKFLLNNIRYPHDCAAGNIYGKVYVEFVIDKTGKVTRVKLFQGVHPSLDAEALRVVRKFPKWRPANQNGKKVIQRFVLPINFRIQ